MDTSSAYYYSLFRQFATSLSWNGGGLGGPLLTVKALTTPFTEGKESIPTLFCKIVPAWQF